MNPEEQNLTLGEARVRVTFNPDNNSKVDQIKQKAADLINLISSIEDGPGVRKTPSECGRLKALAMTEVENAAMWAVKAETADKV